MRENKCVNVHNVGNRIVNTYVYPISNGYVMIDTGYEHSFKAVTRKLNRIGIALSEIKYVFLTHAHDDHAGFLNELLKKCPNLQVIISDKAIPTLLKGQNSFVGGCSGLLPLLFCKFLALIGKGKHLFPPIEKQYIDRFIQILPQNITAIEELLQGKILFTPGHTSDSISLVVGNIIFCGDAAMNGIPSLHRITIWIEDKIAFQNSWNTLIAEEASMIYSAHGKPFCKSELEKYNDCINCVRLYKLK